MTMVIANCTLILLRKANARTRRWVGGLAWDLDAGEKWRYWAHQPPLVQSMTMTDGQSLSLGAMSTAGRRMYRVGLHCKV